MPIFNPVSYLVETYIKSKVLAVRWKILLPDPFQFSFRMSPCNELLELLCGFADNFVLVLRKDALFDSE